MSESHITEMMEYDPIRRTYRLMDNTIIEERAFLDLGGTHHERCVRLERLLQRKKTPAER